MSDQEIISRCPECGDTALQESHGLFSTCHVCHESYSPHSEEMGFERTSWEEWASSVYSDDRKASCTMDSHRALSSATIDIFRAATINHKPWVDEAEGINMELGDCPSCGSSLCWSFDEVLASPTMEMRVEELEAWLSHHKLGLSVSFNERCYSAELRTKIGNESIVAMEAKAAEFGVAVIAACQNYEREYAQRID